MQVCFEVVGYLLEELRDAKNFEALKEDVATANIFIGSLIFIEELAEKVSWGGLRARTAAASPTGAVCGGSGLSACKPLCGRC